MSKTQTRRVIFDDGPHDRTNSNLKKFLGSSLSKSKSKNYRPFTSVSPAKSKGSIKEFDQKVRKKNKKYIPRSDSAENLKTRMPWGVNESRLNNYVL